MRQWKMGEGTRMAHRVGPRKSMVARGCAWVDVPVAPPRNPGGGDTIKGNTGNAVPCESVSTLVAIPTIGDARVEVVRCEAAARFCFPASRFPAGPERALEIFFQDPDLSLPTAAGTPPRNDPPAENAMASRSALVRRGIAAFADATRGFGVGSGGFGRQSGISVNRYDGCALPLHHTFLTAQTPQRGCFKSTAQTMKHSLCGRVCSWRA